MMLQRTNVTDEIGARTQWTGAVSVERDRRAWPAVAADEPPDDGSVVESGVAVKPKPKTKRPSMYKVMLLNDDYTPMEFVVHVLERFFSMSHERAVELMLAVHTQGVAIVGVFTYEIAETKVTQVMDYARQHQHPLQCAMEKE